MTNYAMNWRLFLYSRRWRRQQLGNAGATGRKLTVAGPRGSLVVPEDYAYRCMSAMNPECPHCAVAWKR